MAASQRGVTRREVVWALTLSVLLTVGIVGTLLLQTAMDTQAQAIQRAQQVAQQLSISAQQLRADIDRASDPATLAARAEALRMRPQVQPQFIRSR